MKMEHWLMIVASISTLIAPLLNTLVRSRIKKPKPTPEENQPKNLSQSKGARFKRHLKAFWPVYFGVSLSIGGLINSVYKAAPVTRLDVLFIGLFTASLALNIMSILVIRTLNMLGESVRITTAFIKTATETTEEQTTMIHSMTEAIRAIGESLDNPPDKPPETILNKVRARIKNMLGD